MKRSELFYDLPSELIAQHPLKNRCHARLLVINRMSGRIEHCRFSDLGQILPGKSFFIVNDSKVIPARLLGTKRRSGGKVEIFLLKKSSDEYCYEVLLRPLNKIKNGDIVEFAKSPLIATVVDTEQRLVKFNFKNITGHLARVGHMPLPPYIKRPAQKTDQKYYQTVYAKHAGSVAAPTAGLHFAQEQVETLKKQGHDFLRTTLHVNYATFKDIEEDNVFDHKMHFESYDMSSTTLRKIQS